MRRPNMVAPLSLIVLMCWSGIGHSEEAVKPRSVPLVGMISLIVKEPVQKELGIAPDSEELANIKAILKPFSLVLQDRMARPSKEDIASGVTPQDLYARIESEFVEQIRLILKPEQFRRLQQIHWQRWGVRSIEDPEMAEALELSERQMQLIETIRDQFQTQRKELESQRRNIDSRDLKEKLAEIDASQSKAFGEILSPDQAARLDALKGEPFELADSKPSLTRTEPKGPVRARADNLLQLVLMEPVLEELEIGPASPVVVELHQLYRTYQRERREQISSKGTAPDRSTLSQAETTRQLRYEDEVKRLLTPAQFARLREIYFQRMGPDALHDAEVASHLNLSEDQKAQIAELNLDKVRKARDLINQSAGKQAAAAISDDIKKKIQDSIIERESRAFEILTPAQQAKWQEMTGKPFDLSKLRRAVKASDRQ